MVLRMIEVLTSCSGSFLHRFHSQGRETKYIANDHVHNTTMMCQIFLIQYHYEPAEEEVINRALMVNGGFRITQRKKFAIIKIVNVVVRLALRIVMRLLNAQ